MTGIFAGQLKMKRSICGLFQCCCCFLLCFRSGRPTAMPHCWPPGASSRRGQTLTVKPSAQPEIMGGMSGFIATS